MGDYLYLKSGDNYSRIFLSEILFAKAERKYVRIVTASKAYFIRGSILCLQESSLSQIQFFRIHKSYIVSLQHITGFDKKTVSIGSRKLPIGRHYKDELYKKLPSLDIRIKNRPTQFSGDVDSLLKNI